MSKQMSFEEKMEALEQTVAKLESGNVPLEEMIALYEQGAELYRACDAELNAYEKYIEKHNKELP